MNSGRITSILHVLRTDMCDACISALHLLKPNLVILTIAVIFSRSKYISDLDLKYSAITTAATCIDNL